MLLPLVLCVRVVSVAIDKARVPGSTERHLKLRRGGGHGQQILFKCLDLKWRISPRVPLPTITFSLIENLARVDFQPCYTNHTVPTLVEN